MNKKGFTLIELLAVIALLAVVSILVFYGTKAVENGINKYMWCQKVSLIENAAVRWGEDHKSLLSSEPNIEVQQLFGRYLSADTCKESEIDPGHSCIKNDIDNTEVNERTVKVYIDNNLVYAKFNFYEGEYDCK